MEYGIMRTEFLSRKGLNGMYTFQQWAKTPPMGWNSWNCYGAGIDEAHLRANADFMAKHLKAYGWEYVVCDIQWSEPDVVGHRYRPFADLTMDAYGRLLRARRAATASSRSRTISMRWG